MTKQIINQVVTDQKNRIALASQHHEWFFGYYFGSYLKYESAPFHKDFFNITEDTSMPLHIVMAFRGSAKSSIFTTSMPIWSIIGKLQYKLVVIASQTQHQARRHLDSIKRELEGNELLQADFGPFRIEPDEWGSYSIVLPKYDARIVAISTEQSVRGIRHKSNRPNLIICDDVEDLNSVRTSDGRKKTFDWFSKELLPAGDKGTRTIVVGNLLHEDSLLMRYMERIDNGEADGKYLKVPIVEGGKIMWPGNFPDKVALEKERRRIGDERSWQREYLLRIVPDDDQIIHRKMLHFYDEMPPVLRRQYARIIIGVDLAISESDKADFTAILEIDVRGTGKDRRYYIRPNPTNKRMSFKATVEALKQLNSVHYQPKFYIEQTAYQAAVVEILKDDSLDVEGVTPKSDKRSRLSMISDRIERGQILFPKKGAETLITQLVGFGVEKHDDLVDALTTAILEHIRDDASHGTIRIGHISEIYGPNWNRGGITRSNRGFWADKKGPRTGREYWNRRLDDFEEATSGEWD